MNAKITFASFLSTLLILSVVSNLEAAEPIRTIKNGSELQKSIETTDDNELIYIDLIFKTSAMANNTQCASGQFGPLAHSDNFEFQIKPVEGNNNLLMAIIPGSKTQFPYNAVSCPYNGSSPTTTFIRFRGFYVALRHMIPTANLIELRPTNVPYELAVSALQK